MSLLTNSPETLLESQGLRDYISNKIDGRGIKEGQFYAIKAPNGKPMLFKTDKIKNNLSIFEILMLEYGKPFSNLSDKGWYFDKYTLTSTNNLKDQGNIIISSDLASLILKSVGITPSKIPETDEKLKVNLSSLKFNVLS